MFYHYIRATLPHWLRNEAGLPAKENNVNAQRTGHMLVFVLMLLFVAACGGMEPDTEPLPVYPEAEVATDEASPMAGVLRESIAQQQQEQGFEVDTEVYTLPPDTDFAAVQDFYDTELSDRGWSLHGEAPEIPNGDSAAWERGRDQAFMVMTTDDPISNETLLVTMRATR
jgi:hypothetical protein